MAVGDTVGDTFAGTQTFTPAAGVECLITYVTSLNGANSFATIGTGGQSTSTYAGQESGLLSTSVIKVFVRNAFRFTCSGGGGVPSSFAGIQIK